MQSIQDLPMYIDGQFLYSQTTFDNINPVNGQVFARVSESSKEQVDSAVTAARKALAGEWGNLSAANRSALLHKVADGIQARFEDFVAAEVSDTGRPASLARTLDVPRAIANFRTFADLSRVSVNDSCETELATGERLLNYTVRKPLGVIAVISPWNLPLLLLTWKLGPALAMGNTVVCKPSEETPSSATLLAQVMHDAGVPAGVFNVIHGFGVDSAGEFLTQNSDIDAVSFTGESRRAAPL